MSVVTLRYEEIAPGLPFHAALVTSDVADFTIRAHDHDFAEFMLILDGQGIHYLNGRSLPLTPGQIWSLGPKDAHSIHARLGKRLTYINVAFPVESWSRFVTLAGIALPPHVARLEAAMLVDCSQAFHNALMAFTSHPTELDLVEFFVAVGRSSKTVTRVEVGPIWLQAALTKMRQEQNLFAGLPRLVRLCSVSPAHLSRVVRQIHGVTPTELVNRYRIDHAKLLLATTAEDIDAVAFRCGLNNVEYFYRVFKRAEGTTPRAYRRSLRQKIAP